MLEPLAPRRGGKRPRHVNKKWGAVAVCDDVKRNPLIHELDESEHWTYMNIIDALNIPTYPNTTVNPKTLDASNLVGGFFCF